MGYVHGDTKLLNLLVRDDMANFMLSLVDFDWAGLVHQTFYPMFVNHWDIERLVDTQDRPG